MAAPSQNQTQGTKMDTPLLANPSSEGIPSDTNLGFPTLGGSDLMVLPPSHAIDDQHPDGEGPAIGHPRAPRGGGREETAWARRGGPV